MVKNTFTCTDGTTFEDIKQAEKHQKGLDNSRRIYVDGVDCGEYIVDISDGVVFLKEVKPS
ncbi:hypothetical protein N9043_01895 [bacterium]|nr:hypothetical protein [bacterium]